MPGQSTALSATRTDGSPRIVRALPGRLRIHLPGWEGADPRALESALRARPGVLEASARGATGNVLVRFDPARVDAHELLSLLSAAEWTPAGSEPAGSEPAGSEPAGSEPAGSEPAGSELPAPEAPDTGEVPRRRLRIPVYGIDRDPRLARRVVELLERRPGVRRAVASATTGRVLVEFSGALISAQDILAELSSSVELPDVPAGDRPDHPLDPAPLVQSTTRLIGSAAGLALIGAQRALGLTGEVAASVPAAVAGAIGILDGAPPLRNALSHAVGRDTAQLLLGGGAIASLTLSGSPLGLAVSGAAALRMVTEVRARRDAWRDYEGRLEGAAEATAGGMVALEPGARVPLDARVLEGRATVLGADGLPDAVAPGDRVKGGARIVSGTLTAELTGGHAWEPRPRPAPPRPDALARYLQAFGPFSVGYGLLNAAVRRSPGALFTGLLLVNARAALIGTEAADTGASARVLRAGVTVVGTRPERQIRRPDVLVIDGPRTITSGFEVSRVAPGAGIGSAEAAELVGALLAGSGVPWSGRDRRGSAAASETSFDGCAITGTVAGRRLRLAPAREEDQDDPGVRRARERGEELLLLRQGQAGEDPAGGLLAYVHLRPTLAAGLERLSERCRRAGVEVVLLERDDRRASRAIAARSGLALVLEADLTELVRERQRAGERVAVLSDSPSAAEAFEACDLAIGLSSGRSSQFQARADLLAPGLAAVAAIIDAGVRRDDAVWISLGCSVAANLAGATWGLRGEPGLLQASRATYLGTLAAIGGGWARLRGGHRARSIIARLTDPRPERYGAMEAAEVLAAMRSSERGLESAEAAGRRGSRVRVTGRNALLAALGDQLDSPLTAVLGLGAAVSLAAGSVADVAIIGAVIATNACVGAWQERQAGQAARALERMSAASARVLRDGQPVVVPAEAVVRGDILLVGAGDRVVADARLICAEALEVDEASLTGESLPVVKSPDAPRPEARILLEGSDVTVGSGRAVVVAVGRDTRLGATAAALAVEESSESPLGRRLDRLFRQGLPLVVAGGALVTLAGVAWGGTLSTQLAVGASVAVAAVPEGLPLLAGVAEAAVARRLAARSALVRRLSSVEALGRVDVVCCDKTGTLTQGRLAVAVVEGSEQVLEVAALATPAPDTTEARAHPTDVAILNAALAAGLHDRMAAPRIAEAPFDPVRALHATAVEGMVAVKGASEVIVKRCVAVSLPDGSERRLDAAGRRELLARAERLAAQGLRVLMVARGPRSENDDASAAVEDPHDLLALGFIGIRDPLRPGAADAVRRSQAAGIRVVMLTGDHPATARAIAAEAGLPVDGDGAVVTGEELAELENGELSAVLESACVLARISPIDKLRIVDALKRSGHTVAMTGDGVNDAPALRLADVGVAMGAGGTEVARQAADVVLGDDRFETLTDALLEGRSLWGNLHHALGLLLGGNLGEVGLMAGAAIAGRGAVLSARQVLAVNLVTDILPAVAVVVQPPRQGDLEGFVREGAESFDRRLVRDIIRRGFATGLPSLTVTLLAPLVGVPAAPVAFASIIATQLAQTLEAGRHAGQIGGPVLAAAGGSLAVLGACLTVPSLRAFLGLPAPGVGGVLLAAGAAPAAVAIARLVPPLVASPASP